jgi:hypothetical protein
VKQLLTGYGSFVAVMFFADDGANLSTAIFKIGKDLNDKIASHGNRIAASLFAVVCEGVDRDHVARDAETVIVTRHVNGDISFSWPLARAA